MRHYKQPQLVSYAAFLQQGKEFAAAKRDFLQSELARAPAKTQLSCSSPRHDWAGHGVVLTHASLIDRARVAAKTEGLSDSDVAMAYLHLDGLSQNFFKRAQPLVVGYCACCPNPGNHACRHARDRAYLLSGDAAGYWCTAHPNIDARGRFRALQSSCRLSPLHGRRTARRRSHSGGEAVPIGDRIAFAFQHPCLRPASRCARHEQVAGGLQCWRRDRPGSSDVLPLLGHQSEATLWLN